MRQSSPRRRWDHAVPGWPAMSYQQRSLTLLLLILTLDYGDRALVGAMGPTLEQVFHFGTAGLGLLVDRVRRTRLLAVSFALWAGAMVCAGASISFTMLFACRLMLGAVAATSGPTIPSVVGDLVPASDRGKALGFVGSGQLIGNGVAYILAASVAALSFRWGCWLPPSGNGLSRGGREQSVRRAGRRAEARPGELQRSSARGGSSRADAACCTATPSRCRCGTRLCMSSGSTPTPSC